MRAKIFEHFEVTMAEIATGVILHGVPLRNHDARYADLPFQELRSSARKYPRGRFLLAVFVPRFREQAVESELGCPAAFGVVEVDAPHIHLVRALLNDVLVDFPERTNVRIVERVPVDGFNLHVLNFVVAVWAVNC